MAKLHGIGNCRQAIQKARDGIETLILMDSLAGFFAVQQQTGKKTGGFVDRGIPDFSGRADEGWRLMLDRKQAEADDPLDEELSCNLRVQEKA